MWFRGRTPRNEAVVAAPSSSIVGKSNASSSINNNNNNNNNKLESDPSSRKKRPKQQETNLNTTTTQKRQVSVTPIEHAAILRERIRLQEARQKRNDESKRKCVTITDDAPTGRLCHKEKQTSLMSHKSRNMISRLNGSVSYRRNGVASRTRTSRLVKALFFILGFGLAILFVYSPFLHVDTSFQSIKQVQQNSTKVYFLNASKHVDDNKDLFSASWLQPVESFLKFDTSGKNLATKQAGSNALFQSNLKRVQMTLDWLDFSVEHLSSWIHATDTLKYNDNNVAFHVILSKFYEYIKSVVIHDSNTSMKDTIAVIAFEPWSSRTKPHVATQLSVASLAATIASLIQAGFGRVVVVGYHVQDEEYANESFRLLLSLISSKHNGWSNTSAKSLLDKIQGTEMAYVRAATEEVISLKTPINIVKGALAGLQNALMSTKRQYEWLGAARNASSWKYVYLTEADSILQTKPSSLPYLKQALDQGMILAPHRLQALPHEYDLAGMNKNRNKMVPATTVGNFSTILQLHPWEGAVCCDEYSQVYHKPWEQYPKCNSHWWQCGFNDKQDHSRLEHYNLIRLSNPGMNLVSLAANHNGRQCKPSNSGTCIPPNKAK
jgi:hypothetical protein